MTTIDRHSEAAALAFGHATANTAAALRAFAAQLDDRKLVAGLEGRMFVRAGLDPAYATEEARDRLVRTILTGDLALILTPASRARVAAAVLAGWMARPAPRCSGPVSATKSSARAAKPRRFTACRS